jgi:hypothetical protein
VNESGTPDAASLAFMRVMQNAPEDGAEQLLVIPIVRLTESTATSDTSQSGVHSRDWWRSQARAPAAHTICMSIEDLQGYAFVAAHDHVESVLPQELLRHVGAEVHTLPTGVGPTAYSKTQSQ